MLQTETTETMRTRPPWWRECSYHLPLRFLSVVWSILKSSFNCFFFLRKWLFHSCVHKLTHISHLEILITHIIRLFNLLLVSSISCFWSDSRLLFYWSDKMRRICSPPLSLPPPSTECHEIVLVVFSIIPLTDVQTVMPIITWLSLLRYFKCLHLRLYIDLTLSALSSFIPTPTRMNFHRRISKNNLPLRHTTDIEELIVEHLAAETDRRTDI